jgi:hypothetical protein
MAYRYGVRRYELTVGMDRPPTPAGLHNFTSPEGNVRSPVQAPDAYVHVKGAKGARARGTKLCRP